VLKHYVFWGLFTLVLIGIGMTLVRRHRELRKAEAAAAEVAARRAAGVTHAPKSEEAAFDPNATRVHFRTSPVGAATELLNREEAILPVEGSAKLVCVGGTQKGHSFPVTSTGVTVGRDPQNDVVIADPRASSHHAWVGIVDHKAILRDLGSTNGTFLNAQMDALVQEATLISGDTIFFGGHGGDQFRFVAD
jgi:hypothetical protein